MTSARLVIERCDICGMKLNLSKTKTIIVSRSRRIHLQSPILTIGRAVLTGSVDFDILGERHDFKMTFVKHRRCKVCRAASQMLDILRKSWGQMSKSCIGHRS